MGPNSIDRSKYAGEKFGELDAKEMQVWVIRVYLDHNGGFYQDHTECNSMWLHNSHTDTTLEYAKNKLIISLSQGDISGYRTHPNLH